MFDKPSYCNIPEGRGGGGANFYFLYNFYPPTLNIICFTGQKLFLRFCLCIFKSDTVKSDCPVQIFLGN